MTVKELRALTGLTQKQFAEILHTSKRSIENWETGLRTPNSYVLFTMQYLVHNCPELFQITKK